MAQMGATRHAPWGVTDSIASCSCRGGRAWGPQRGLDGAELAVPPFDGTSRPRGIRAGHNGTDRLPGAGLNVSVDDSSLRGALRSQNALLPRHAPDRRGQLLKIPKNDIRRPGWRDETLGDVVTPRDRAQSPGRSKRDARSLRRWRSPRAPCASSPSSTVNPAVTPVVRRVRVSGSAGAGKPLKVAARNRPARSRLTRPWNARRLCANAAHASGSAPPSPHIS